MNTPSNEGLPPHQWHLLYFLVPFIIGIYLADYRNFTEFSLYLLGFLAFFSACLCSSSKTRQIGLVGFFLTIGFCNLYFKQAPYLKSRELQFTSPLTGVFTIYEIETKGQIQKLKGCFCFKSEGQSKQIDLLVYSKDTLLVDQRRQYALKCLPEPIQNEAYRGAFDQERYYELQKVSHRTFVDRSAIGAISPGKKEGFAATLLQIKGKLSQLFEANLSHRSAAIARALVIGERDGIDQQLRTYFLATGSMHILAVSGMHIGLLILALLKILGLLSRFISRKQALLVVLLIVWYYALLTGLSASVLRSVFMFSVLLVSQLVGRQINNLNALFFSAFCLLLYDPRYLFDLGFQLSYTAMLGIYLYYELIKQWLVFKWRFLQQLWDGSALGLAATLTTLPLSLYHFHLYPNYAQIANLCLMSLSSLVLVLGMFFPLLQAFPLIDKLSAFALETCIYWMLEIMRFFSEAPGALAKGFDLPFWWVMLFWLLTLNWFYNWPLNGKKITKKLVLGCLIYLSFQKQQALHVNQIYFFEHDRVLLIRKGNKAQAFGPKPLQKCAFLFAALENLYAINIDYHQLQKGTTRVMLNGAQIRIRNLAAYQLKVTAQKQTQKIEVF